MNLQKNYHLLAFTNHYGTNNVIKYSVSLFNASVYQYTPMNTDCLCLFDAFFSRAPLKTYLLLKSQKNILILFSHSNCYTFEIRLGKVMLGERGSLKRNKED